MRKATLALLGIGSTAAIAGWYSLPGGVAPEATAPAPSDVTVSAPSGSPAPALLQGQRAFPEAGRVQDRSQRAGGGSLAPASEALSASSKPATRPAASSANTRPAAAKDHRVESDEHRTLTAKRMNLEDASRLRELATDPSPLVRDAALERLRQLEGEYEMEARIERRPGEPGQFLPTVLDALDTESDPFAIKSGLDYLGEYGENDPRAAQTLEQLLQRPDLPATVLMQIGELLAENHGLPPEQVKQLLLDSPSAGQLLDEDLNGLGNAPQTPDDDADGTPPRDEQTPEHGVPDKPRA